MARKKAPQKKTPRKKSETAAKPGGVKTRKRFVPTSDQRELVAVGVDKGMIAEKIRGFIINPQTGRPLGREAFFRHFKEELEGANMAMIANALGVLRRAMKYGGREGVTAAIFVMKTRAGWSEKQILELTKDEPLEKLTPADQARVLQNAITSAEQNEESRKLLSAPTIDDEPAGHA